MANNYKNILIAVDGSEESNYAFKKAIQVSKGNIGSTLHIVHVIDKREWATIEKTADYMLIEYIQKESKELLDNYHNAALEAGLENVQVILDHGVPKSVIPLKIAKDVKADLIICGATGKNVVDRVFMGSVSQAIVRKAKCDVLVIRMPE